MNSTPLARDLVWRSQALRLSIGVGTCALLVAWRLRYFSFLPHPSLSAQLQLTSGILAFTFAAIALLRFRGTRERLPLIFAGGFVIVGFALTSSHLIFIHPPEAGFDANLRDPMSWVISRTLLAVLLVAGLVVERHFPTSRNPSREIVWALIAVVLVTSLLSATHWRLPAVFVVQPGGAFPRPGNLFPAALFLIAAIGYYLRLKGNRTPFDRSLYIAALLNIASCLAASQSDRAFDSPFAFAEILQVGSYAVLLAGGLFDNAQLFASIREQAVSDPLTGLANYRRLADVLASEIERAKRTGNQFALLLFDLDGLKKINDQYGHLVGTRAICRVADALLLHSRAIDTAARHGGDEFALVLPETGVKGAEEVAARICDCVSKDAESPHISISAGIAVYPQDGQTIESLLSASDQVLYKMKHHSPEVVNVRAAKST